jgi:hypothetical protein
MVKKILILLVLFAAGLQVSYQSKFIGLFSKAKLVANDYTIFSNEFRSFALLFALLVLLGIVFLANSQTPKPSTTINRYWYAGCLAILLFSSATAVYVNPQGRFPWNRRNVYIAIEARSQKLDVYKKLGFTPDLIWFGSSVSFQLPMSYLAEKWNLRAFNMAVNGGGPNDFVNLINPSCYLGMDFNKNP